MKPINKDTSKISIKIDRGLYKKLQQIKLDTETKTISDVIAKFVK